MSRQAKSGRRAESGPESSQSIDAGSDSASRPLLPLLILLFIGSGCAALIYEIVWFQLLQLIVGSSAISMAVVLTTFMGGMCLGSLLLPRFIKPDQHPLKVYGLLELGIAALGLIILFGLTFGSRLYPGIGGGGALGVFTRALFCVIWLIPPTLLMGATLPAIARWVETTPQGVSWLGFFYGGNIAGAVLGCVLAGFYLLRVHDMTTATFAAVAINVAVGLAGVQLARRTPYAPVQYEKTASDVEPVDRRGIYVAIALSGLTALASEGVWTRLVTLLLGGTVYTFSMILAVVLLGLGVGSVIGATIARSTANPRIAFAVCQVLLVVTIAWAAEMLMANIPYWPINPGLATSPWFNLQLDFARCLVALLPASVLWGASFPLALGSAAAPGEDAGRLVGSVYAANTVGAIVGAVIGSVLLIPWLGTQNAQRLLMMIAGVSAAIVFVSAMPTLRVRAPLFAAGAVALAALLAWRTPTLPALLVAYGRYAATWQQSHGEFIYVGEGMNSSMAVSRLANGVLNYHNAGKVQASSEPQDMRLQRMLGHLTTLLPTNPSSVLVIGCGAGVTAGAVSVDPAVKSLTIAEIEPLVPKVVSRYFGEHNFNVVDNPKVHVQIDDARHFLLTTKQTFDAVTSDPFDPWVKGAATLYSKEFFEAVREKLNPGGVMTVFVQLYESGTEAVKSEIATFMEVFPNGIVFANMYQGEGYDVVLVGQKTDTPINIDAIQSRLSEPQYSVVAGSLQEIGINSALDLFATYAARGPQLKPWLADAQINRDRNLRLQFLAGMGVNAWQQVSIYRDMARLRDYPEGLFAGSPETLAALRSLLARRE